MSVFDVFFCLLISEMRFNAPSLYSARQFGPSRGIGAISFAAWSIVSHIQ